LIDFLQIGRSGELLTAYFLESFGVQTALVHMGCTDILAIHKNYYVRIQVKSREQACHNRYDFFIAKGGKKVRLSIMDCDILALVGLPHRQVYFMHILDMTDAKHKRINCARFSDDDLARSTWDRALNKLENCNASMGSRDALDIALRFKNVIVPPNVVGTS